MKKRKKGQFKVKGYGTFKRSRNTYSGVTKKGNMYFDLMGEAYKTRKEASSGNAFIEAMGL